MELGTFSVSLTVKDLAVSRAFYEKLGFSAVGGDNEHYTMMRNGTTVIGLFQGLFDKNILTFNPGWSGPMHLSAVQPLPSSQTPGLAVRSAGT